MQANREYLPAGQVRARYGVSDMSLWRWLHDPKLGFPAPIKIHKRRYWKLADLQAWEASRPTAVTGVRTGAAALR
jgi:predicted DNA-binding transcriptional regulator AlpA